MLRAIVGRLLLSSTYVNKWHERISWGEIDNLSLAARRAQATGSTTDLICLNESFPINESQFSDKN